MALLKDTIILGDASVTGTVTATTIKKLDGTNKLILLADGTIKAMGTDTVTFLRNDGSWAAPTGAVTSLTLNGSAATTPSFYAPTDAGTSGLVLKSNGAGAPTWTAAVLTDKNVAQTNTTATNNYPILASYSTSPSSGSAYGARYNANITITPGSGKVNASGGFYQTSDIRKKNILGDIDLDKAYNLIDKCQTILYTLKDDKTNTEQIGLIALEVKEFFPEIVSEDANGLSLDYARLTVVILRVLKDLIDRVKKLEG